MYILISYVKYLSIIIKILITTTINYNNIDLIFVSVPRSILCELYTESSFNVVTFYNILKSATFTYIIS